MKVVVLLRGVDLGDRVHGIFTSQEKAEQGLKELHEYENKRLAPYGTSAYFLSNFRYETFEIDVVVKDD